MKKVVKIRGSIFIFLLITLQSFAKEKGIIEYENDDAFEMVIIDVNDDGVLDRIFYSKPYEGNKLVFFVNRDNVYKKELESTNFSEDGGLIIREVFKPNDDENVLVIKTYFPDRGTYNKDYYIGFRMDNWVLTKMIVESVNWQEDPSRIKICEIKQNVLLKDFTNQINALIIDENDADDSLKICYNKYGFEDNLREFVNRMQNKAENELICIDRYEQLFGKFSLTISNVSIYNDIAYYLEQRKIYKESIYIIEKIILKFPNRTVAYINLGDAYWGLNENIKAKEAYNKYIELMKANGKEGKIPQRILDRVK
ncbi:tetratricopeptide repeat protein [Plebeiibacterium sediminum]|uniref:Tetratricopeptide repeat protein n=1 Tax=Plebeiibacterium sediminum TaxID=2992112 RepID=A0AAE3M7V0_9BACT|nr:tetratricopeptide repeat protein [Plebeiobacterium sediminum]MCW3788864.1 hypothetical protein [Plebeiobacterium sediminum]